MAGPGDLIHQTSTATGAGSLAMSSVNGKRMFTDEFGSGGPVNQFVYYASNESAAEWERGRGHESGGALVRDTVIASSNANAAVNFSAGVKDITNDMPANKQRVASAAVIHSFFRGI